MCWAGVAVSNDGITWLRGDGLVEGHRGEAKAGDVGVVLGPNTENWWTLDTAHLQVSDVQVSSSGWLIAAQAAEVAGSADLQLGHHKQQE